jgi:hypothetical protein
MRNRRCCSSVIILAESAWAVLSCLVACCLLLVGEYAKLGLLAAAGLQDSTAEMSVLILGPSTDEAETAEGGGADEPAGGQPQIYPLSTEDDVSEKQLRRCAHDGAAAYA